MRENVKNKFNKTTGIFKPQFSCGLFNFGQPSKISFRKYLTQEKNVITRINSLTRIRPRTRALSSTQLPNEVFIKPPDLRSHKSYQEYPSARHRFGPKAQSFYQTNHDSLRANVAVLSVLSSLN